MKKIFLAVVCALVVASCGQKKGQTEGVADAQQAELDDVYNKVYTAEEIADGWTKRDIPVENGSKQPNIAELLAAFNKTWTTEVYANLPTLEKGQTRVNYLFDADAAGSAEIDILEDYANVMPGDSPEDILRSSLWRRSNGHTLFAITISGHEDNNPSLVCFYDYDPKTQTMKPETDNAVLKYSPASDKHIDYILPERGTALMVAERADDDYQFTWNVFEWDGMKFNKVNSYTDDQMMEALNGVWMNEDESFPFTFRVGASLEEGGSLGISDCGIYGSTEFEVECIFAQGKLQVYELADGDQEPSYRRSLDCDLYLTKDGKLRGGYYIRQSDDREWRGIMTLAKQEAGQEEQSDDVE